MVHQDSENSPNGRSVAMWRNFNESATYTAGPIRSSHLAVRVSGEPKCFLINSYGDLLCEITASSLVKVDLEGTLPPTGPR